MKVYIVSFDHPYQGSDLLKIFASERDAWDWVKKQRYRRYRYGVEEVEVVPDSYLNCPDCGVDPCPKHQ